MEMHCLDHVKECMSRNVKKNIRNIFFFISENIFWSGAAPEIPPRPNLNITAKIVYVP